MEYNTYIKVSPAAVTDQELLQMILEVPGERQELERYISQVVKNDYETLIFINYKGINLIVERVTMATS